MSQHKRSQQHVQQQQASTSGAPVSRLFKRTPLPPLTFSTIERPVSAAAAPAVMTELHKAVLATFGTKNAVSVPLPKGVTGAQLYRTVRAPLAQHGHLALNRLRKAISVDSVKFWVELKPTPEQKAERKAKREQRKAAKAAKLAAAQAAGSQQSKDKKSGKAA